MDPLACLMRALRALNAGDIEEARDALQDYRDWRNGGGFEPTVPNVPDYRGLRPVPGDTYATRLEALLRTAEASAKHRDAEQDVCQCAIQWVDDKGNPTPDTHVAIGRARIKAHDWFNKLTGEMRHSKASVWIPICAEHALTFWTPACANWQLKPLRPRRPFAVTYEIVTPESAEDGEAEEKGYIEESATLRDAITELFRTRTNEVDGVESVEPSERDRPRFITVANGMEYRTGAHESRALHIPDFVTRASAQRILRLCKAR